CNPHEFRILRQVGQESHLQSAVVGFASLSLLMSAHVLRRRILAGYSVRYVLLCLPVSLWVVVSIVVNHEACPSGMLRCDCSVGSAVWVERRGMTTRTDVTAAESGSASMAIALLE